MGKANSMISLMMIVDPGDEKDAIHFSERESQIAIDRS